MLAGKLKEDVPEQSSIVEKSLIIPSYFVRNPVLLKLN